MKIGLTEASICSMLDDLGIEKAAELIQYYIETREGLKGYCRT